MAMEEERLVGGGHPGIDLYVYATSPFAAKVRCYLDYKGLLYNILYVDPLTRRQIAFTGQGQIPVLAVDGQWRLDSTPIGIWLDELYPQPPLLPADALERQRILELDDWVTERLIPLLFRQTFASGGGLGRLWDGWRLSHCLHRTRPMPLWLRLGWPWIVPAQAFIKEILAKTDPEASLTSLKEQMVAETVERLAGGPFLGGRQTPSLADLSAFPMFVLPYALGTGGQQPFLESKEVMEWLRRVQQQLPDDPLLLPADCLKNPLPL
ncbi:MAG: glutathione S-transferase family protein [Candidatus Competibacteraceae bacterium]|nr:glutathione S-transferase family protein [Candidatus Competibacteraceae bacterium]